MTVESYKRKNSKSHINVFPQSQDKSNFGPWRTEHYVNKMADLSPMKYLFHIDMVTKHTMNDDTASSLSEVYSIFHTLN